MFARLAAVSTLAFAALATAQGSCSTGTVQCCESLENTNSIAGSTILAILGLNLQDVTAKIGLKCSPLSVVGVGSGNACKAEPVCCQNNNVGGLVSIGCAPVSL
ncbi:fungal hydrophobin-domain-containing protein [Fomes fomentarius]|nr:fungal hydrophobin-domain-containing protein [Fomes fomentarius]